MIKEPTRKEKQFSFYLTQLLFKISSEKLTKLKGEIDKNTLIVGDLNTLVSITVVTSRETHPSGII